MELKERRSKERRSMEMGYDVTIGIPVYQAEQYLSRALESALAQTYSSIEFLLVDDGSTDGSLTIVEGFQKNHSRGAAIRLISHDHNLGVSAARNRIIEEASGVYLYFMDADDVIAANTITLLMDSLQRYEAEIAFGSYEKIRTSPDPSEGGECLREVYQYPELQLLGEDQFASFAYRKYAGIQASACNYLVKTSLLRDHRHRFIDTDYWEDLVFTFDLVTFVTRAVLLPNITYSYWCHENSLSRYQQRNQIQKEEILRNARTIDHLRETSSILYNKVYFPNRCYNIVMTGFYMACHVLKRRQVIIPSMSDDEIRSILAHPATFRQICCFRQSRWKNLALYLLGRLPAKLCATLIRIMGQLKSKKNNELKYMAKWYEKYLSIYGKSYKEIPDEMFDRIKTQLAAKQSTEPLVSVVVIAYNEEMRLAACLWSLSEFQTNYPIEILGVNNNSKDRTEQIYQRLGLPYFNESKQSPGYARQCGLDHAKGKYHFCIDADTFYPPRYVDLMMRKLSRPNVSCVSSFWSFFPDECHSALGLHLFELARDLFLFVQHFKRPELCVRGMVFAFNADYARKVKIRTDIRRGEDGSLALSLKSYGKIAFLYNRKARPVTGYGTIGSQSLWQSFVQHVKIQGRGIGRIFYKKDHYEDRDDNLVNPNV